MEASSEKGGVLVRSGLSYGNLEALIESSSAGSTTGLNSSGSIPAAHRIRVYPGVGCSGSATPQA